MELGYELLINPKYHSNLRRCFSKPRWIVLLKWRFGGVKNRTKIQGCGILNILKYFEG